MRVLYAITLVIVVFFVACLITALCMFCRPAQVALRRELRGELLTSVYPIDLKRVPPPMVAQRGIPKQIFRTWEDDSWKTKCHKAYDHTAKVVPDWPQKVFTNKACDAFVRKVYAKYPDIIDAYELCNYGVMKADLWRYLVIYHYGGLYLDMKSSVVKPIDLDLNVEKAYVDRWHVVNHRYLFGDKGEYQNWWVMAPPKSIFLWKVIWQVVRNVLYLRDHDKVDFLNIAMTKTIKHDILATTGPFVYSYIAHKHPHLVEQVPMGQLLTYIYDLTEYNTYHAKKHYSRQTKPLVNANVKLEQFKRTLPKGVIPIPTIYINLDRSKDRRAHMEKWLSHYEVQATRLKATNARNYKETRRRLLWREARVDGSACKHRPRLTHNEVGCAISHLRAIQYAQAQGYKYTLILEDDASFEFVQYWPKDTLVKLLCELPSDAGILQLSWYDHDKPRCRPTSLGLINYTKHCWSTTAYVITAKGARDILSRLVDNQVYCVPSQADHMVYHHTNAYKSGMPLFMPDEWGFASTINTSRSEDVNEEGCYTKKHYRALRAKYVNLSNKISDVVVYLCMTTIPERLESIWFYENITHLLTSMNGQFKLHLSIPITSNITKQPYHIPARIQQLAYQYEDKFVIYRTEHDYGPITKILGAVQNSNISKEAPLLVCDDDLVYHADFVTEILQWWSKDPSKLYVYCFKPLEGYKGFMVTKQYTMQLLTSIVPSTCYRIDDDFLQHFFKYIKLDVVAVPYKGSTTFSCTFDMNIHDNSTPKWKHALKYDNRKPLQDACKKELHHLYPVM